MHQQHRSRHLQKTPLLSALVAAAALTIAGLPGRVAAGEGRGDKAAIPAMPASLSSLYPPASPSPIHLFAMLGLQDAFSGIAVDLLEGDDAGARATFTVFQERYRQTAGLVPEWRDAYPEAPVNDLGAALVGTDPAAAMQALDAVGAVCHRCHAATMATVQLRYRWGNFAAQTVTDPLAGDTRPYPEFKRRLAATLTGITHDLKQGQAENARRQFQAFGARFDALRNTCLACHATPRRSFVDSEVLQLMEELGRVLAPAAPEVETAAALASRIGQASCSACHLVHIPAAMAQASTR